MTSSPSILEIINAVAQIGTLLVVLATAIAGVIQLRHLRASNELEALLRLTEHLREPELQAAFEFVHNDLAARLEEWSYRGRLVTIGFVDPREHPEMDVCNWFDEIGALVKNGLIDEGVFLDLFDRLVIYYWAELEPVVALLRRNRGPGQYENFEYLARLATTWKAKHPHGTYPSRVPRMPMFDRFAEADAHR